MGWGRGRMGVVYTLIRMCVHLDYNSGGVWQSSQQWRKVSDDSHVNHNANIYTLQTS